MPEFNIGDEVDVLFQQIPIRFKVKNIATTGNGDRIYSGEGDSPLASKWWYEEQLDYHMEPELRGNLIRLEMDLQELAATRTQIVRRWKELDEASIPKSLKRKYHALVGDAMGWSDWDG